MLRTESINNLQAETSRARGKFPTNDQLLVALIEEVGEVARAVLEKDFTHARIEALQVATVAMRLVEEGDSSWVEGEPALDRLASAMNLIEAMIVAHGKTYQGAPKGGWLVHIERARALGVEV